MTGRWAVSPIDLDAHLLAGGDKPETGLLKARCAAELPSTVKRYDKPPGHRLCPACWIIHQATTDPPRFPRGLH